MKWWRRRWVVWLGPLVVLAGLALLAAGAAPESVLANLLTVLAVLWALALAAFLAYRLWRRLTYRIGVRLFLSYLVIGVLPFALFLAVGALGGYILVGQYTSARFSDQLREIEEELAATTSAALAAAEERGAGAGSTVLETFATSPAGGLPSCRWLVAAGGEVLYGGPGAEALGLPSWVPEEGASGPFLVSEEAALGSIARHGDSLAAVLVPLDLPAAEAMSRDRWYEVRFAAGEVEVRQGAFQMRFDGEEEPEADAGAGAVVPGDGGAAAHGETASFSTAGSGDGVLHSRWVYFVRPGRELVRWSDGGSEPGRVLVALLLTSPAEALEDLFRSPYQLGRGFLGIFLALSGFFFALYLAAVAVAVVQIVSVARSTARLSRGTERVEAGDLAHRIPVRRRDQLGDLAHSFNHMTASVEEMLAGVAERERLKREMELAREIQQSLLPERELRHGVLSVVTFFRPAAEVGGDYFDLFPLPQGRLLVTVGDVAGHGLSTGLLMAMVKSAAATLVAEGHRGADLLQRLNRLMLEQPREHRMVTFAAVDLDPAAGTAEVTSAGHPPAVRLSPGGEVEEVLLPALPAGTRWRRPPPTKRLPLPPGCRLVLYSDGLTEALSGAGEPFGYPRLLAFLRSAAALPSGQLLEALLAELERFTAGSPQGDDQTLLVLEHQAAPAAE